MKKILKKIEQFAYKFAEVCPDKKYSKRNAMIGEFSLFMLNLIKKLP